MPVEGYLRIRFLVLLAALGPLHHVLAFNAHVSYPTFKTHFKNGDSYQVMTQAIRQEPLLTTLHPLPAGSRIMGGQEKRVSQPWLGNMRGDSFRSTTGATQSTLNGDIAGDTPGQQRLN
jgi:hypothetical protein